MNMNQHLWEKESVELFRHFSMAPIACYADSCRNSCIRKYYEFFWKLIQKYNNATITTFSKLQIPYMHIYQTARMHFTLIAVLSYLLYTTRNFSQIPQDAHVHSIKSTS